MAIELNPSRWLVISDLQIPFHHSKALEFCVHIQKHFNIPAENILCQGDELDQLHGGLWPKDPNGIHSAMSEYNESLIELKRWYEAFPVMRLATSNHGTRWIRKATQAEIPSVMLRRYEEVLQAPSGWRWQNQWRIHAKYPFILEHGDNWGGRTPHVQAAISNGVSTTLGHHHSIAGVEFIKTNGLDIWGMTTGSLIDFDSYAFHYARNARFKPQIGVGVVVDNGRYPQWIPL